VHAASDNSERCIRRIISDVIGTSVCDVGCGTGYLLKRIRERRPESSYTGIDFVLYPDQMTVEGIEFKRGMVEELPFADETFDTVLCTHVLEHILDYRKALLELRRVTRRRLIIVVPQEREARFTFNPHFQFFAYPESLLRAIHPIPASHECLCIGRDIYYREEKSSPSSSDVSRQAATGAGRPTSRSKPDLAL
ncbi:MAG: class I SAM-dependent methyltransferase, partial [Bradyrhizobium sp.]